MQLSKYKTFFKSAYNGDISAVKNNDNIQC